MAASFWPARRSETIYISLLLICFFYVLVSSPIGEHAQSIVRPGRQASGTGKHNGASHSNTTSAEDDLPDAVDDRYNETTAQALDKYFGEEHVEVLATLEEAELDDYKMGQVGPYIRAIMDPRDTYFNRLQCPRPFKDRYKVLRPQRNVAAQSDQPPPKKRYFFALNLYQCAYVLPRLLASVVEAMRKLGPEDCVLSIVGGRSDDGTTEILAALREEIEALNVVYYFGTSDIDPLKKGHDRVTELAKLRNLALAPLFAKQQQWAADATVIFVNDVSICTDDILELVYQKHYQQADMVCAMDWNNHGATFYDSWIGRSMNGDLFVEIPQSGSFEFASNLFWNDKEARRHIDERLPLQVFACWNGAVAFKAEPLLLHNLKFRAPYKDECYTGEPTLFCKDLWALGYGRIAVIPSVNVGYNDDQSRGAKEKHGYASGNIQQTEHDKALSTEIKWERSPPGNVKCQPDWRHSSWAPWDDALEEHIPFDWTRSGYFNAKQPFSQELEFEDEIDEEELETAAAATESQAEEDYTPEPEGHGIDGDFHGDGAETDVGEAIFVDEMQG
jgi:alpha-1,3-mannosyltransferase